VGIQGVNPRAGAPMACHGPRRDLTVLVLEGDEKKKTPFWLVRGAGPDRRASRQKRAKKKPRWAQGQLRAVRKPAVFAHLGPFHSKKLGETGHAGLDNPGKNNKLTGGRFTPESWGLLPL